MAGIIIRRHPVAESAEGNLYNKEVGELRKALEAARTAAQELRLALSEPYQDSTGAILDLYTLAILDELIDGEGRGGIASLLRTIQFVREPVAPPRGRRDRLGISFLRR